MKSWTILHSFMGNHIEVPYPPCTFLLRLCDCTSSHLDMAVFRLAFHCGSVRSLCYVHRPHMMWQFAWSGIFPWLENWILVLSRYGKAVYPTFESGGGTADHLTGSLLSNWCVLEIMLCSDFFSDLCFLTYKFLEWIWRHDCDHTMWLSELETFEMFWDLKNYFITETDILWHDLREYMCYF